jgi:hypothetical protein
MILFLLSLAGCATFNPRPIDEVPFRERAQTQYEGNVRVTAAVPGPEESEALFGVAMYKKGIQPVWLEIENNDEKPVWFMPVGLDTDYFSPLEVAYMHRLKFSKEANQKMGEYFHERTMGMYIPPGVVRSGFVFTHLDLGTKGFDIDVVGEDQGVRTFTFFINVPGLIADHQEVDWDELFSENEIVSYDDEVGLREALENLPCCTTNRAGTKQGNPINVVFIGKGEDLLHAFIRGGWNETGSIDDISTAKAKTSSTLWRQYRYEPVDPLYLYGRPQDAAFRKNRRETASERNVLRLWLSPLTFEGKPVWLGQVSREIGLRFSGQTVIYRFDPSIDDARTYVLQDLWYSQGLLKYGYVKGVGEALMSEPREALKGDRYFTDGLRGVMWVSSEPISFSEVEVLEWEIPVFGR